MNEENLIIVGKIGAPHGVRGWVRVISFTGPEANVVEYPQWWVGKKGAWRALNKQAYEAHGNKIIVLLEGFAQLFGGLPGGLGVIIPWQLQLTEYRS
jgi:16S rRNA processing protein RimM